MVVFLLMLVFLLFGIYVGMTSSKVVKNFIF